MHRLIGITGLVIAGACAMACGGHGTDSASTTALTSASPRAQADERSFQDRISTAICVHEVECGRGQPASCIDDSSARAARELGSWTCDPADARASAEQCLAAIRAESCSVDLVARANICPLDNRCSSAARRGGEVEPVPPGASAAEIWRR